MNQRENWIDNLKGIGIILVVFLHSTFPADNILVKYLFSIVVPLFFFLSGFLFNQKPGVGLLDYLRLRFNRLIVPYLIFNTIAFVTFGIISKHVNYLTIPGIKSFLRNLAFGIYSGHTETNIVNIPTWFLPCLFFTGLYYFLIDKYIKSRLYKTLLIIFISVLIFIESKFVSFRMPLNMDIAFMALLFYGIGNIFKNEIINFVKRINYYYLFLVPILVAINILFLNITQMSLNDYDNYFKLVVCVFSGIFTFIIISKVIGKSFLGFYGENSIIVLCMEWTKRMCYSLVVILSFHTLTKSPGYIPGILQTVACLVFLIPTIFIINKYFPFLIGIYKRKKNPSLSGKNIG